MNVSCFIRKENLEEVLAATARAALNASPVDGVLPDGLGLPRDGFIARVSVASVAVTAEGAPRFWGRVQFQASIGLEVRMIIDVGSDASVAAAGSGAAPRTTLIADVLYYLSMRQPLNSDRPQVASSLLLEAVRRNGLGTVTGPGGTSVDWVDAFSPFNMCLHRDFTRDPRHHLELRRSASS